jgi:FkbM family methyltransferase
MKSLGHYRQKLRDRGPIEIIAGRLRWYWLEFQLNNWWIGKIVELSGNTIRIDDVTLSVDNPLITTEHKSALYFGIYEIGERELSKRFIDRGLPTVEIGGSIGGVACTTNKLLADPRAHVVIECNPIVLPTLERNRTLNKCSFTIEPRALAYDGETMEMTIPRHFMLGHLQNGGGNNALNGQKVSVPTITLKEILEKYHFEAINLISDSQGGEVEMVEQESAILRDRVKWLIIETHAEERGKEALDKTLAILGDIGFEIRGEDDTVLALFNRNYAA